jgi:hypothetical protein
MQIISSDTFVGMWDPMERKFGPSGRIEVDTKVALFSADGSFSKYNRDPGPKFYQSISFKSFPRYPCRAGSWDLKQAAYQPEISLAKGIAKVEC